MEGLHIVAPGAMETIEKKEIFESVDNVKVKVTHALLVPEDFITYNGDPRVEYPIIPGRVAIGKIAETCGTNSFGFERGMNVLLHSVTNCKSCYECAKGEFKNCASFITAGKNSDGFLRDFAIMDNEAVSILPPSVGDNEALFIEYIAVAERIIDNLNLQKGEHVVIVGGDILGIILAQLIIYYQSVPILVDNNENNLSLAVKSGVYYTIFADNKIEKSVSDLTGARLASKVVYMTGSNLNTDIALKLAGHNATICFAGFGTPTLKVSFTPAIVKQLNFTCVSNGFGCYNSAINILANKAIDTSFFSLRHSKSNQAMNVIHEMSSNNSSDACANILVVDMDKF